MQAASVNSCLYCGSQSPHLPYCCQGCEALDQTISIKQVQFDQAWTYLDQDNFKKIYQLKSSDYDYQLYVQGLHCSSCVYVIEKLPEYDETILEARIDYGQSKLLLKVKSNFSLSQALMLISKLGYTAHFLKPDESILNQQVQENKILLKKMAVAGACAGNIMLFVIPVYSGLAGPWKTAFNWMSFGLFLPVVFYSGTSFYKSAWAGLKLRLVNIDLPITVALVSSFILSTINLIRGNEAIYFDSTASFIFLILASRYFLKRTQQKFLTSTQLEDFLEQDHFIKQDQNSLEISIHSQEILVDDILVLQPGQICPVDGLIESESALIDASVLNGEPLPRRYEKGMLVLAGARILEQRSLIKVIRLSKESHVAKILNQLAEGLQKKSQFVSLTDRLAQRLIVFVFLGAVVFFAFYFNVNPQEAFNRSLALIVLACPCALALGTPLAFSLAVKKAQAQGILIKNVDALEKILKIKNVFFDKTGTLTNFQLELTHTSPLNINEEIKKIILSLEQKSEHPLAFALRQAWPHLRPYDVQNLTETSQRGFTGIIQNHHYEIGPSSQISDVHHIDLELKKEGLKICSLSFENSIRAESKSAVNQIRSRGLNCFIISGDLQSRVDAIALQAGVPLRNSFGDLSSVEKKNKILSTPLSCMIGDGTNDALALQKADVGIAVKGSTLINMQAADIYLTRGGLQSFIELFNVAEKAKNILIRNLTFSLIYNLMGGSLALLGFINPWMAAILMPISSVMILGSTLWGLR